MNKDEVLKLAQLARIGISDAEAEELVQEFEPIIAYVSEIKAVATSPQPLSLPRRGADLRAASGGEVNVMREDGVPHEGGKYTKDILNQAPSRAGQYISVKKIL